MLAARVALAGAVVALAVFAPLVLFVSLVQETLDRDIVRRGAEERLAAARIAGASIERELDRAGTSLGLLASRPTLRRALLDRDRAQLERDLGDLVRQGAFGSALALDPAGVMLARQPVAPELYGQSFADRDYYRGAVSSSRPFVSEAFISRAADSPTFVAVAFAVRDGDTALGIVQVTIRPADLLALLEPLRDVAGRELLIADKAGRAVASTDPGVRPLDQVGDRVAGSRSADGTSQMAANGLITAAPVASADWTLYVIDDQEIVLAGERRLSQELLSGGVVAAFLAVVAAAAVIVLYGRTERQRDELRAGRAALAQTNQALREASRHKSEFLASMSHELRTPLNAILGFSDLLGEQLGPALSERQRRYLSNIREAGTHLLGLINDVLDLSKVEAGRVELRTERITLADLTAPAVASARAAARTRGVAFDVELGGSAPLIVDAGRLRQILYNLLSNAVKFTGPGGHVALRAAERGGALEIEVSDTGIGIPEADRARVFGTFERLHEGRSEASGTGLGLALTKRLVELHHGTISFTSREGEGTTFRVVLPDVLVPPPAPDRVLVVEDDRRDADLIVAIAAGLNMQTEVVGSVGAALDAVRLAPPVAVVLDLRLPDGRGERVLEALRADPATRGIPVSIVTVEDDDGITRGLGAEDHLTKPIDGHRLGRWLSSVKRGPVTAG